MNALDNVVVARTHRPKAFSGDRDRQMAEEGPLHQAF